MALRDLYRTSLALLTDLYQVTMASGYHALGRHEDEAVFHLFFRELPFGGDFALSCGLDTALEYLADFRFSRDDLEYLATLEGNDGGRLLPGAFLEYLESLELTVDIDAVPEGTAVFAHEPLVRVRGPLLQCQLLETALLNIVNFQSLIATKAARVAHAAGGAPVLEFGLRRAQGIDGGVSASRAAFVGGCAATSNVLAGRLFGIPVSGTHAHSWVMSFDDEQESFDRYSEALPNNAVFLVDTYDSIAGIEKAIRAARELRVRGHEPVGVRLDSGDLAELSQRARRRLDECGFPDARVVASGDLDETSIAELRRRGARIDVWGVGTKLATAFDQPALGGVYKLAAIRRRSDAHWTHKVKRSDDAEKSTDPGILQVRRFRDSEGVLLGDVVYDELEAGPCAARAVAFADSGTAWELGGNAGHADLLAPVVRAGRRVQAPEALDAVRERSLAQHQAVRAALARYGTPYRVGLEPRLGARKARLLEEIERQL